jgi:hypothetical protein
MFIVREPKKNRLQPRRGGMGPLGACHAAPTGLKSVVDVRGGYKHVAPPELEPCRIREREVAGAKESVERMAAGGFSCEIRSSRFHRYRSRRRLAKSTI